MPARHGPVPFSTALKLHRAFRLKTTSSALGLALAMPFAAQVQAQEIEFDIRAQALPGALQAFGRQAGVEVLYSQDTVQGKNSKAVKGKMQPRQALTQLLGGTGIAYSLQGNVITLTAPATGSALELGVTNINGLANNPTTEGSGSYTSGPMSTATKLSLSQRKTPQSTTVITRQRMDDQAMVTLEDAIRATPGVTLQKFTAVRPLIYSRGFQVDNLMFDGLPTIYDGDFLPSPDLAMFDRVEVVRGANGLTQGSGNPSAAINLVRKRPTRDTQVSITGSAGSWDNYRTELDAGSALTESGNVRGRMVASYNDKQSFRDVESTEASLLYGITEFDLSDSTMLTVGGSYQNDNNNTSWGGLPVNQTDGSDLKFSRSTYLGSEWEYYDKETKSVFAQIDHELDYGWNLRLAAMKNWTKLDVLGSFMRAPAGTWQQRTLRQQATYEQSTYDAFASGPFQLLGREHELVVGGSWRKSIKDTAGSYANIPTDPFNFDPGATPKPSSFPLAPFATTTDIDQKGVYVTTRLNVADPLKVILGARVDWYQFDQDLANGTPPIRTNNNYNVVRNITRYAGVIYDLDDHHSLYASYTDIFQPQVELASDRSTLKPITGENYEVGIKGEYFDKTLNASAALYQIDQVGRATQVNDCAAGQDACFEASGKVRTQGIDLEFNGAITPNWQVGGGYTYAETRFNSGAQEGGTFDPDLPRHIFKLNTNYRLPGDLEKWRVGGAVYSQNGIFNKDGAAYMEQSAYTLVDLMTSYQVNKNLLTQFSLNNVFDKTYYEGLASFRIGGRSVYGAPRNFTVSAKYTF